MTDTSLVCASSSWENCFTNLCKLQRGKWHCTARCRTSPLKSNINYQLGRYAQLRETQNHHLEDGQSDASYTNMERLDESSEVGEVGRGGVVSALRNRGGSQVFSLSREGSDT